MASDGRGGAIVTWRDNSLLSNYGYIYAQRISADGEVVATELKWYDAVLIGPSVTVSWELSTVEGPLRFAVLRGHGSGGAFERFMADIIDQNGSTFRFTDRDCEPGESYRYRVDILEGTTRRILFETGPVAVPAVSLILHQSYPNPFNPSTMIAYDLPERCRVALSVYTVDGRLVVRLVDREELRGRHEVRWDGCDRHGSSLPSGLYWCRLSAGKAAVSKKMILVR